MAQWHDAADAPRAYVPVLRGDSGDLEGLAWLPDSVKDRVTPLVEVAPGRVDATARRLAAAWGADRRALIDTVRLDPSATIRVRHHVVDLFDSCRGYVRAVPVGGLDRGIDHTAAIARVVAAQGNGAALRIDPVQPVPAAERARQIDEWLAVVDLSPDEVDVIADLGEVSERSEPAALDIAQELLWSLPYHTDWRSVTLTATAFPRLPANGSSDHEDLFKRLDWRVWNTLATGELPRTPGFGDHVPSAPRRGELGLGVTLAYTTACSWLVVRRRRLAPSADEMRAASQAVMARPEYAGATHCRGCAVIMEWAAGEYPARLETWRAAGTCHHIQTSVSQLGELAALGSPRDHLDADA